MSDHKYTSKSGFPTFWNHIIDSVEYKQDVIQRPMYSNSHEDPTLKNKRPDHRCLCSNCEAHIGFVYDDGPLPFNKRFLISDNALIFEKKPFYEMPDLSKEEIRKVKTHRKTCAVGEKKYKHLLKEENKWNIPRYEDRERRDKQAKTKKDKAR